MKDIKILALDSDGVINSIFLIHKWIEQRMKIEEKNPNILDREDLKKAIRKKYIEEFVHGEELVFPELAERITKICKESGCYILWSSTWRKLDRYKDNIEKARDMFNRRGLPGDRLIGYTPSIGMNFEGHCRGSEISRWIKEHTEFNVVKCAVLDDRCDAGWNLPTFARFFPTNDYFGITNEDVENVIAYFKEDENV